MTEAVTAPVPVDFRTPRRRIFNPLRLTDREIEQAFIARRALLASLLSDLAAENDARVPQHHLVVGQRGMGKTTLLCRVAVELRKPDYRDRFLPLTFPEEQYIETDRLSKFWMNCLDAMADALEASGDRAAADDLDRQVRRLDRDPGDEATRAERTREALQAAIARIGRRPVLLLDNLHLLLARLREHDYVLRGFFTRPAAPVLIGAATVWPDSLHDYGAAFYDSFKTHVLHRLSADEMREIIAQLAREASRPDVAARLHAVMPRLRALRDLTGGNPRTTVLLFELLAQGFSDDPYEDLESLLDQVTPLYQSRIEQLSEQAQLLFAALARQWSPATAEQLTEATRLPRGSVSPQLGRLESIGLVEKTPVFPGKKTGYQIAERFFNIWYLMRFASRRQRTALVCLTRFLEGFYTPPELETRARRVIPEAEEAFRKALEIDPSSDLARHNLVFLLRDLRHNFQAARQLVTELTEPNVGKDTQALHQALFAAYEADWNAVRSAVLSALAEINDRLPPLTRDDWCRASAVLVHLGFGPRLVDLLVEQGADVRLMPWFAAVQAHVLGDQRYLQNIPAEARQVAGQIYTAIDRYHCQLPANYAGALSPERLPRISPGPGKGQKN